jgi:hypothetical protein
MLCAAWQTLDLNTPLPPELMMHHIAGATGSIAGSVHDKVTQMDTVDSNLLRSSRTTAASHPVFPLVRCTAQS